MSARLPLRFARSLTSVGALVPPAQTALGAAGYLPPSRQSFLSVERADGTAEWQAVGGPYRNVREFGAVGDGTTDDTAALRAAVAAVLADVAPETGMPRNALYVPAGVYVLTDELWIRGDGFRLFGDGRQQTVFMQTAAGKECVLRITGAVSEYRDFTVYATPPALPTYGLLVDARTLRTSTNLFHGVWVSGEFVEGVRVGYPGNPTQCDQQVFTFCGVTGGRYAVPAPDGPVATKWRAGFVFGSGTHSNNLAHAAYWLQEVACQHGVEVQTTQLYCAGGLVQTNEVDFYGAGSGYLWISGMRSEGSPRFFDQPNIGGFQSPMAVHVTDCIAEGAGCPVSYEWLGRTGATGAATVTDPTAGGWTPDQWAGYLVLFRSGNLAAAPGDWFTYAWNKVVSNTADTLTVVTPWGVWVPDVGSEYVLVRSATGGTGTTLVDATRAWKTDEHAGLVVWFLTGGLIGQHARVVSNTANTLVLDRFVFPAPDTSTAYVLTNAAEDCAWFRCQVPGVFEASGVQLYGTPLRWAVGRPPVMLLHGDKRPALWTLGRVGVKGASRREAVVTNGTASVLRLGYQEIDAAGDVANPDFAAADPATQGGLDLISTLGLRVARPGALFAFDETLGHPLTAGLDPGEQDGECALVGDVRADGGARSLAAPLDADPATLSASQKLYKITAAGGTYTLPSAAAAGAGVSVVLRVADFSGGLSGAPATFVAAAGQSVKGGASLPFAENYGVLTLVSDGATQWAAG